MVSGSDPGSTGSGLTPIFLLEGILIVMAFWLSVRPKLSPMDITDTVEFVKQRVMKSTKNFDYICRDSPLVFMLWRYFANKKLFFLAIG